MENLIENLMKNYNQYLSEDEDFIYININESKVLIDKKTKNEI